MSTLADRLRGLIRPVAGGPDGPPPHDAVDAPRDSVEVRAGGPAGTARDAAEILGGDWCEARGHRFLVVDRKYSPGHRHGWLSIADGLPPTAGLWPRLSLLAGTECPANLLFVDLETTGIAGGAGTYAFLIGCAWFDGATFRIRQLFLSTFAAERALLDALADVAGSTGTLVTYNGKTFDLPLIETRFLFHRMETPFAARPHIDMLHPARRLWRDSGAESGFVSESGCRLSVLERTLCGHVREGDVPGFEIPGRYFQYVRSGDPRPLAAVFEHNRLDLLSLALLTARAAQLLDDGATAATTAREALGLGRLYERANMTAEAHACFARAAGMEGDLAGDAVTRAEGLRAFALLSRRERRYQDAARAWERILSLRQCPPTIVREATEALAVHHEHRLRDPLSARTFALQSLQYPATSARRDAVHHRLARLNRKVAQAAAPTIPF